MSSPIRKSAMVSGGSSSSLAGAKFSATLDLLRLFSSNIFKLDAMLKVHDEEDIEMKQGLVEALDSIRKVRLALNGTFLTSMMGPFRPCLVIDKFVSFLIHSKC